MSTQRLNYISGWLLAGFSLVALLTVLTGYFQAPQADEGAAAHIFQLSVVLVLPAMVVFLATADWRQRRRSLRPLVISVIFLASAFAALYYLEHYFYYR
jgi:uncharacterized membrane protein